MSGKREPVARGSQPGMVFILRLWSEQPAAKNVPANWRLSLQDVHTQARRGFASLEEFFTYLETVCGADRIDEA